MQHNQILMLVGVFVLGMLSYHMLKGTCGCKLVEGIEGSENCQLIAGKQAPGGRQQYCEGVYNYPCHGSYCNPPIARGTSPGPNIESCNSNPVCEYVNP